MTHPGTGKYEQLLERCRGLEAIPTAVAWPCDETSLTGAIDAAKQGLITPILVGPAAKIAELAKTHGIDLRGVEVVDVGESHAAAAKATQLVREGKAELLMKGSLHSDEILAAVVAKESGLRGGRRLSHVFLMDVPTYHKVLIVTDAAINIAPTLEDKVDIVQNAIDRRQGLRRRAAEGRDPRRGRDGELEDARHARRRRALQDGGARANQGRRARRAARVRQCDQPRRGQDQRYRVRGRWRSGHSARADLEAGNMMAKQLSFLANADSAGLVLGARVPGDPDQPGRQPEVADRELRRRSAGGACPSHAATLSDEVTWTTMRWC
jgi:hypothetical protein